MLNDANIDLYLPLPAILYRLIIDINNQDPILTVDVISDGNSANINDRIDIREETPYINVIQ